jgi:ElaB/YqjD/DUF883 family membrane-anchored ribosome-binding protein
MGFSGSGHDHGPRAKDVRNQLAEAEFMLGQVGKATGENAGNLLLQVETKLRSAMTAVQGLQEDAMGRARAAGRIADDYVSHNPWQVVGVAAALGFLVGALVGRR